MNAPTGKPFDISKHLDDMAKLQISNGETMPENSGRAMTWEKAADIAGRLVKAAENAKLAGDEKAHIEILVVALQYVALAKSFKAMEDASRAMTGDREDVA